MFVLTATNSIAVHYLSQLRDVNVQNDRLRFRRNLERIGELLAYEISKTLNFTETITKTPLGEAPSAAISDEIVLVPILRAGIPFYNGFMNVLDAANSAFVASCRASVVDGEVKIDMGYVASDNLDGKVVILIDPMLASGKSLVEACDGLLANGTPKHIHFAAVIGSEPGVRFVTENVKNPHSIWVGGLDSHLNEKAYIVPGLGDAGDLCFGPKL